MAQGVGFSIDTKFLNLLKEADDGMQKIIDKSNELGRVAYNAFSQITKSGVVNYVKKLEQELTTLNSISQSIGADSGMRSLKKDIDAVIKTNNALVESLKGTSQYTMSIFSQSVVNTGQSLVDLFKQMKTANDAYLNSLESRFKAEQQYQQRQQSIKSAREQETKDELRRYQQILDKIRELEKVQNDASKIRKQTLGANDKQGINAWFTSRNAEEEALTQLKYYREEAAKIEQKHEAETLLIKQQNTIKEFNDKRAEFNKYLNDVQKRTMDFINSATSAGQGLAAIFDQINKAQANLALKNFFDNSANRQAMSEKAAAQIQATEQNRLVRQNAQEAAKAFSDRMKVWEEGFRRAEEKEKQLATNAAKSAQDFAKQMVNIFDQINKAQTAFESKRRQDIFNRMQRYGDTSGQATAAYNRLFSGNGNMSLNNMQSVLSKLQDAQRKLNLDTDSGKKKYEQLAAMIRRVQQRINEATGASEKLKSSHQGLLNTGDQLMRKFALIFSVSQIQGYIDKLVQVRGEFELQQRALQSILQNKAEANKIWQQTVDLAVRSPFRVGELVKYTKQLAAYRIETDKLHDTTKRLADVSAGLGVDMSRLILAYGQVRAAEYLRGTELRQFTEAGIPMLEELAKHFTELEGRAVSTADVFSMISKRMVAFEDVAAVFQKMTDAGGVFYNMQEIQAETLKGQISNLHDSIDLMLNDIGSYYDRILKGGVGFAKTFVDNWEFFSFAIKGVVVALAGYKMASLAASKSTQELAVKLNIAGATMDKNLTRTQLMQLGLKKLGGVLKGVGSAFKMAFPLAIFMAVADVIYEIYNHIANLNAANEEINKKHNEELDRIEDISDAYNKLIAQEKKYGKASDDTLEKKRQQIIQLSEKLGENVAQIELQINPLTSEQLDALFKNKQALAIQASDFSAAFSKAFVENFDTWQLWGILGENMKEDAEDFNEAVSDMSAGLKYKLDEGFKEASRYYLLLSENAQGYIDEIKKGKQINETEAQWFSRKAKLMSAVSYAYQEARLGTLRYSEAIKDAYEVSKNFEGVAKELKQEVDDVARDLLKTFGKDSFKDLPEEQKIAFVAKLNESEQLAELGLASDFIRSYLAEQYFGITINLNPTDDIVLQKWQDSFNKKFGDNPSTEIIDESYYGFRKITDSATTQAKVIEQLQSRWKSLNDEIKAVEKAGAKGLAEGGSYEGYNLELSKQNLKQLQEMMDWFGADYEKKKGKGKQRDIWGERARAIQDLRKNYEDLIKTFTKYDTISRVTRSKQALINELFKDLGYEISNINFDSLPQLVDFISQLQEGLTKGSKDWLKLENIKAAFQLDIDVKTTQQARDEFMRGIESMFGNYEMSLELEKLNIPPDLAKQLFGVESVDLSEIRRELETHLAKLRADGATEGADEEVKKTQEKLKKVEELERKAQEDRLKKYVKYLQKAQSEAVRIKINELNQLDEIEKTFQLTEKVATSNEIGMTKEEWAKYRNLVESGEEINKVTLERIGLQGDLVKKVLEYNQAMKVSVDLAKKGVRKETEDKLNENQWKLFKESSRYKLAFSDIESQSTATLKIIEDGIKSIEDSLSKLDVTQMKELADLKQKVFDIKVSRNPFKALETSLKDIQDLKDKGLTKDTLLEQIVGSEEQIDKAQHTIDLIDIALNKGRSALSELDAKDQGYYDVLSKKESKQLHDLRTEQEGVIANNKEAKATAEQNLDTYAKADQAAKEAFAQAQQATEMMQKAYGDLSNILSAVGVEMGDSDDAIQNIGFGLLDLGMQIAQIAIQANIMGVAFQTAMGPIGWISIALSAVSTVLTGIFAAHDNSLERDIQNTIEYVEKLERAYQRLEKRIESAYSAGWINSNYADASKNIQSQINSYKSMIAFEDEKKNTDQDKIREWKNEIEDLTEQLSELEQQRIEALGGFGSEANYKSAAEEFASAWFDAYREVGDGISGLEDTFDEFINNVVKKQLLIRGSQQLLQPLLKMIDNAVNDGMVTTTEMAGINKEWNDKTKDALNEYYKAIYDMYDGMIAGAGELSDLQRGIQNITEPQAAAIEAYLNSVRAFVSDSNTQLKNIYNAINVSTSTPIMSELRTQTELIRSINENIGSVIGRGRNGIEGAYIKVLAH